MPVGDVWVYGRGQDGAVAKLPHLAKSNTAIHLLLVVVARECWNVSITCKFARSSRVVETASKQHARPPQARMLD